MRKSKAKKRILLPDPRFQDTLVTRFVNNLMLSGKKNKAFGIFYNTIDIVAEKTKEDGLQVWKRALTNVSPQVEVKSRRIGGANYQIPQEVRPERKVAMAIKWLIFYAKERKEHRMSSGLASEIIAAAKNEGGAWKKKEDVHRMAEANKAYSHFKIN
ncbi:MAG TPA: 30S ribosomal protein S7 [Bacteroidia bacterium]|jgi:small subunit ribosomal protein S7|nr:30S ribosomal protein S7 [Bacteroidia bacterium]HNO71870.1 30S ribosomal protein S7 [Bacteroidia bacterium]